MRRSIAVLVAAVVLALPAPLWAQAPEATPPAMGGRGTSAPTQSRPITPSIRAKAPIAPGSPAKSPVAPPALAVVAPSMPPGASFNRPPRATTEQIDQAAKDSVRALDLQTTFPRRSEPTRIPIPAWIVWVLVIVFVAIILFALRDTLFGLFRRRDEGWEEAAAGGAEPELAHGVDALAAADRLCHDGRFVEAMHMLLLQGLADVRERLGETFADSLTSREILRGARLDPAGRTSLRDIISAVELTYFGGYPARAEDYDACRRNYDGLRRALRGGAAA
jgi:hypothetical protein